MLPSALLRLDLMASEIGPSHPSFDSRLPSASLAVLTEASNGVSLLPTVAKPSTERRCKENNLR